MHACTCSVVSCGRVFCRLCNGQRPNDEVSGLIVDLVFLGLYFVAFSSSRALPFALVSRDLSLPRLLVLRQVSPSALHLLILVASRVPEFIHLPPLFACGLARCRKKERNRVELPRRDLCIVASLCAFQSVWRREGQRCRARWTFSSQIHLN